MRCEVEKGQVRWLRLFRRRQELGAIGMEGADGKQSTSCLPTTRFTSVRIE